MRGSLDSSVHIMRFGVFLLFHRRPFCIHVLINFERRRKLSIPKEFFDRWQIPCVSNRGYASTPDKKSYRRWTPSSYFQFYHSPRSPYFDRITNRFDNYTRRFEARSRIRIGIVECPSSFAHL